MKLLKKFREKKHDNDLKELLPSLHEINAREMWARKLSNDQFSRETDRLKQEYQKNKDLDALLPDAFALVREAARRVLGERLYDVQILGGIVLNQGRIMELKTGEGKTLSSTAPAYLNALSGEPVHIVTVNDYLVQRENAWMGPVFHFLGLTTGFVINSLPLDQRKAAYDCDITYSTNNEIAFDYLRDNMRYRPEDKMQRGHHYCIIDEIDSILIDGARTPLIISGAADDDTQRYLNAKKVVADLKECAKDPETEEYPEEPSGDYKVDEKNRRISFTDEGLNSLESACVRRGIFTGDLYDSENFDYIHYATQALRAIRLFHVNTHYVLRGKKVEIVDEFTGRILHGRRYSEGLHQAIEAKENMRIQQRSRTFASITFQNFFRMYHKISGMTGTAASEEREFIKIYGLDVAVIPTNRPIIRKDEDDVIYLNEKDKFEAICEEIKTVNKTGQPVLIGTVSIDKSERLSKVLTRKGVRHEVLNAKNHAREAIIIAEAGAEGSVTIATNMAGRGTDIKLGGNSEFRARREAGDDAASYEKALARETEHWFERSNRIKELGGLYILGTERHESRRIDNQLRGRSGRQGDPGLSRFFLSMDDELMRLFGGKSANIKGLMSKIGMNSDVAIDHPLLSKAVERAQNKVEERNFDIRKHLLKFDDVLNEQRKFIYEQRSDILSDNSLIERILTSASDMTASYFHDWKNKQNVHSSDIPELTAWLRENLFYTLPPNIDLTGRSPEEALKLIMKTIEGELREKEKSIGAEILNQALRREYLMNIDLRWQDHLENLEALRESVYLRSYAQKNPLLEYKLEGFQIFDEMLYDIRRTLLRKLILVKVAGLSNKQHIQIPQGHMSHRELNLLHANQMQANQMQAESGQRAGNPFAQNKQAAESGQGPLPGQRVTTVVREHPKVGRNDPCPCGSGKKYKYCHGR
ncbi:MAG: preprotein translocase subunit SecA [Salinispira sp.]